MLCSLSVAEAGLREPGRWRRYARPEVWQSPRPGQMRTAHLPPRQAASLILKLHGVDPEAWRTWGRGKTTAAWLGPPAREMAAGVYPSLPTRPQSSCFYLGVRSSFADPPLKRSKNLNPALALSQGYTTSPHLFPVSHEPAHQPLCRPPLILPGPSSFSLWGRLPAPGDVAHHNHVAHLHLPALVPPAPPRPRTRLLGGPILRQ